MSEESLLKLDCISKSFPGVKAVNSVSLHLNKGEIISLVGQNGAGKSTLVSLIGGIYTPDSGVIYLAGKKCKISNPAVSEQLGIGMVHQEPTLVPGMSVAANIFLNKEKTKKYFILDFEKMKNESKKIINFLGFNIDPDILVEKLTLVEREVVEIAKAMLLKPKILILDEVTAPLGEDEVENLFTLIDDLKNQGMAMIFISHRLKEIKRCADRIIVLRNGEKAGELFKKDNPSEKQIINLMLGESIVEKEKSLLQNEEKHIRKYIKEEQPLLEIINLTNKINFTGIDFKLYPGEILGLIGLKGCGITEIFKTIYGVLEKDCGDILLDGKKIEIKNPGESLKYGIGMITNDRQKEGLALIRNLTENITISSLKSFKNLFGFLKIKKLVKAAENYIDHLNVKTSSINKEVMYLSGGNQQKIVISKWLLRELKVILIDEPTRGVDVKAINEIHKILIKLKGEGKSFIISSPETSELLNICDRLIIVSAGQIVDEIKRDSSDFNESYILENMHI